MLKLQTKKFSSVFWVCSFHLLIYLTLHFYKNPVWCVCCLVPGEYSSEDVQTVGLYGNDGSGSSGLVCKSFPEWKLRQRSCVDVTHHWPACRCVDVCPRLLCHSLRGPHIVVDKHAHTPHIYTHKYVWIMSYKLSYTHIHTHQPAGRFIKKMQNSWGDYNMKPCWYEPVSYQRENLFLTCLFLH